MANEWVSSVAVLLCPQVLGKFRSAAWGGALHLFHLANKLRVAGWKEAIGMIFAEKKQIPLSAQDVAMALESSQVLLPIVAGKGSLMVQVRQGGEDRALELPAGAVALLLDVLQAMAAGRSFRVIPEDCELSTFEAAEILKVSRPFVIQLMEQNLLPHRKVGTHRRVRLEDVLAYQARMDCQREAALDELARLGQEMEIGY